MNKKSLLEIAIYGGVFHYILLHIYEPSILEQLFHLLQMFIQYA